MATHITRLITPDTVFHLDFDQSYTHVVDVPLSQDNNRLSCTLGQQGVILEVCLEQVNDPLPVAGLQLTLMCCLHKPFLKVILRYLQFFDWNVVAEAPNGQQYTVSLGYRFLFKERLYPHQYILTWVGHPRV